MTKKKILSNKLNLLLIAALLSSIVWATFMPLWQFPDEQAHFAQVQNYSELKSSPKQKKDLSFEIYESERILGTLRDNAGRNKYTYNPDYRIEYSNSYVGIEENYLKSLPRSSRTEHVKKESPRYPPLFYVISSLGYLFTYNQDLFVRVFATRLVSSLMFIGIVYFAYKFSQELFPKEKHLQMATAIAVAFHPMLTFVSSGINNDTLLNLLSVVILYLLMKIVRQGITQKDSFLVAVVFALGALTKQLIYLLAPTIVIVLAYALIKSKLERKQSLKIIAVTILGLALMLILVNKGGFWLPFWPKVTPQSRGFDLSFVSLLVQKITQLYRETIPWYWGVFNWLGVVLPLNIIRFMKILMSLSLLGWIKYSFQRIKAKKLTSSDFQLLILIFANLSYLVVLVVWDIFLTRSMGWGHGIQGRYFFPLIATHMALLVFGLWQLISKVIKPRYFTFLIGFIFVEVNLIALYTALSSYYDLRPLKAFTMQVSQYKPFFAKWPYLGLYFFLYLTIIVAFLRKLVKKPN